MFVYIWTVIFVLNSYIISVVTVDKRGLLDMLRTFFIVYQSTYVGPLFLCKSFLYSDFIYFLQSLCTVTKDGLILIQTETFNKHNYNYKEYIFLASLIQRVGFARFILLYEYLLYISNIIYLIIC